MYSKGLDRETGHNISEKSSEKLKARSRDGQTEGLIIGFLKCLLRGNWPELETHQNSCGSQRKHRGRSIFYRNCQQQKVSFCRQYTAHLTSEILLQQLQKVSNVQDGPHGYRRQGEQAAVRAE